MAEWITTTLEECTDILGDGLHGTPKYTENGEYAFVNGNNLVDGEILIKKETKRVDYSQYDKYKKPLSHLLKLFRRMEHLLFLVMLHNKFMDHDCRGEKLD